VSALPFASLIAAGVESALAASLRGSSAARADIVKLQGKVIRLELIGLPLTLYFLPEDGKVTVASDYHGDAHVAVRVPAASLVVTALKRDPEAVPKGMQMNGEAETAQSQLDAQKAKLNDQSAQLDADIRDALLDIASAQKLVEVARSSVDLANEALKEAQQRYANGVSDNLAVSQAEQSVAQADSQYVTSLYQHNLAKLSLARALGAGQSYKNYLGGK